MGLSGQLSKSGNHNCKCSLLICCVNLFSDHFAFDKSGAGFGVHQFGNKIGQIFPQILWACLGSSQNREIIIASALSLSVVSTCFLTILHSINQEQALVSMVGMASITFCSEPNPQNQARSVSPTICCFALSFLLVSLQKRVKK